MSDEDKMTVIGLGGGGGSIAREFLEYPNYNVKIVDSDERNDLEGSDFFKIPECEHEEYDAVNYQEEISGLYESVDNEKILFILCGSGDISGAALRLLYPLRDKDISVIYVEPDEQFMGEMQKKKNRVVKNVLQEYARSDNLEKIYLVKNENLEKIVGNVPVAEYFDKLNGLLVYTIHSINVFEHSEPIFGKTDETQEVNRISTFGILRDGSEFLFYPLKFVRERMYYYSIYKERLETEGTLLQDIKEEVGKKGEDGVSFGIYESEVEDHNYCTLHTSIVQSMKATESNLR